MKVKIVTRIIIVINENNIFVYMHNYIHFLKVVYLKFGLKSFIPHEKLPINFRTPWALR